MLFESEKSRNINYEDRYFLCKKTEDEACSLCQENVVSKSFLYHIFLTLLKGVIGFMTGSKVLVAEAVQSLMDSTTFWIHYCDDRPAKEEFSVPLLSIGAIMFLSGIWICADSLSIIISHIPSRPGLFALVVIGISILVNGHLYFVSACIDRYNPDSRNNVLCRVQNRSNFFSSCFAFAGILLAMLGYVYFDPLAAVLVGCFQIYGSLQILRESLNDDVVNVTILKQRFSMMLGVLSLCIMIFFTVNVVKEFNKRNIVLVPLEGATMESPVSNILGWAPYFCIVDLKENTINAFVNQGNAAVEEGSSFLSKLVEANNVGVVLAYNIGPDVFTSLRLLGVRLYFLDKPETFVSAVNAYQLDVLTLATSANVAKKFGHNRIGWLRPWD